MRDKSVRDLGGEIWTELALIQQGAAATGLKGLEVLVTAEFIDLVMGVLARHDGKTICNHEIAQVVALPRPVDFVQLAAPRPG